ncbi:MAG: GDSL-type esterase/lipase family protein [Candidatus Spechtbacterales bacterium]
MNINPSAKTILCFGDSNTWGDMPGADGRWPADVRWPGVLQSELGNDYEVISEGLCGRTFGDVDLKKPYRAGISYLRPCLQSHKPLDFVIVMLGTNDIKEEFGLSEDDIAQYLKETLELIREETDARVLVICPPPIRVGGWKSAWLFRQRALEMFKTLPGKFEEVTKKQKCLYLNAGDYITSSAKDGFHLDSEMHKILGEVLAKRTREVLPADA